MSPHHSQPRFEIGSIPDLLLTEIKLVILVPIKDFLHHPKALFCDIPRVGMQFYNIPASEIGYF